MSERVDAVVSCLISCVRRRPLLWRRRQTHPASQQAVSHLWDDVLNEMTDALGHEVMASEGLLTENRLKVRWRGLRSCYKRYQRNQPDGDGANWKWAPLMHFVDPAFVPPQDSSRNDDDLALNDDDDSSRPQESVSPASVSHSWDLRQPATSRRRVAEDEDEAFVRYVKALMRNVSAAQRHQCQLEVIQLIHKFSSETIDECKIEINNDIEEDEGHQ